MHLAIVIPCYNEADRFPFSLYKDFLIKDALKEALLVFVNDGSKDRTFKILRNLQGQFAKQVELINLPTNQGKGNAVRAGVLHVLNTEDKVDKIAFLDADLATSLDECLELSKKVKNDILLVFGSRIKKLDNEINRKLYRHLLGRVIATAISHSLELSVYDTQCGCKVFSKATAQIVFKDTFISKWLFDVEIFFKLKEKYSIALIKKNIKEIPLKRWADCSGSKISITYSLKVWYDLHKIKKQYAK